MKATAKSTDYYRAILDTMPMPVFVMDRNLSILDYNQSASQLLTDDRDHVLRRRSGDVMHCIHSTESPKGCGRSEACRSCKILGSAYRAVTGVRVSREKALMKLRTPLGERDVNMLITAAPLELPDGRVVLLIFEDITELVALRRLLPICARCKSVRDDQQYWQQIEKYLQTNLQLDCSHGLCPDCARQLYPELYEQVMARVEARKPCLGV